MACEEGVGRVAALVVDEDENDDKDMSRNSEPTR
jgi:hypothetical protein